MADYGAFIDRIVEHPGRVDIEAVSGSGFTLAGVSDGVLTLDDGGSITADISRNEGTVTQAGTALTAANLNDYIEGMIIENINNRYLISFSLAGSASGTLQHTDNTAYTIFWRSAGNTGSYGIDMLTANSGAVSNREVLLSGTHLPSYAITGDNKLQFTNTAQSTTVIFTVLRHIY